MSNMQLSALEEKVMGIVWNMQKCSTRQIKSVLDPENKLAYTTIATILTRLEKKGMLVKDKQEGCLLYSPKITQEDYGKQITSNFFNKLQISFGDIALVSFARSVDELSEKKKKYLLELLKEHEGK